MINFNITPDGNIIANFYVEGTTGGGGGGGGTGTVTSVTGNGSGLGFSLGGTVTTSGNITLTAPSVTALRTTLNIGNVANTNYTGNGQRFLAGNGVFLVPTAVAVAGGLNTQLQYNDNGVLGGVPTTSYNGGKLSLGTNTEIIINGGTTGQVLTTDGLGNLTWATGVSAGEPIANAVIASTISPQGFDEATKLTATAIGFDSATRTFGIAPTGASFDVWVQGIKYTKSAVENVIIPAVTGTYYIYYGVGGILIASTTPFDFAQVAPIAYIYWNNTLNAAQLFFDERHGTTMDHATHEYLHRTRGASVSFLPSLGFVGTIPTTGTGALDADAQIGISSGTFYDEDIEVEIIASTTPTADTWEQDLTNPGRIPVLYRSGIAWVLDAATTYPVKFGVSRPTYNLNTGGVWSTPDVGNNEYFVQFICASNNLNSPVISIMGQASYSNLANAQAVRFGDLSLTGLPIVEIRPLYAIVYQTSNTYGNVVKARIRSYTDLRLGEVAISSLTASAVDIDFRETPKTVFSADPTANTAWNDVIGNFAGDINFTGSNVTIGQVSNVHITGGLIGQFLQTDGSGVLTWANAVTAPAGNTGEIQFNDNGSFGASSNFIYNGNALIAKSNVGAPLSTIRYHNSTGFNAPFNLIRSRGDAITPTPVQVNDQVGINFFSHSGNGTLSIPNGIANFNGMGGISYIVNGLPTANNFVYDSSFQVLVGNGLATSSQRAMLLRGNLTHEITGDLNMLGTGNISANGLINIRYASESVNLETHGTGAFTVNLLDNSYRYSVSNMTGNVTLNFQGNSTVTANSMIGVGNSVVSTWLATTGATAYGVTAVQIDGVAQTIKWAGGTAPTPGNNSVNAYTFTLVKTVSTPTYTVLGSMTRYA